MTEDTASAVEQQAQELTPQEKVFKKDEVERIKQETAHKSFNSGYEKARKELEKQQAAQVAAEQMQQQPQMSENFHVEGLAQANPQPDPTQSPDIQQLIAKEFQRREQEMLQQQQEEMGKQILNSLNQKTEAAKQEIPDFDEVTGQIDWGQVPDILRFANEFENGGHVLYHLAKNPSHIGDIMNLLTYGQHNAAYGNMKRLADSLKINKEAQDSEMPAEPLGRLETSAVGVGNGKMGVKDYKAKYRV